MTVQPKFLPPRNTLNTVLFPVFASLSTVFLYLTVVALRDERISRRETIFSGALFAIIFLASIFLNRLEQRSRLASNRSIKFELALDAIILAMVGLFVLPLPARLYYISSLETELLIAEDGAHVELFWAYWTNDDTIAGNVTDAPRPLDDIGYGDFLTSGDVRTDEDGVLILENEGAKLTFRNTGLHCGLPTLAFRAQGGDAMVYIRANGKNIFRGINSDFNDPTPIPTLSSDAKTDLLTRLAFLLAQWAVFLLPLRLIAIVITGRSHVDTPTSS